MTCKRTKKRMNWRGRQRKRAQFWFSFSFDQFFMLVRLSRVSRCFWYAKIGNEREKDNFFIFFWFGCFSLLLLLFLFLLSKISKYVFSFSLQIINYIYVWDQDYSVNVASKAEFFACLFDSFVEMLKSLILFLYLTSFLFFVLFFSLPANVSSHTSFFKFSYHCFE